MMAKASLAIPQSSVGRVIARPALRANLPYVTFPTQICPRLTRSYRLNGRLRVLVLEFSMSTKHPPHGDDEFFAALSPLLEEAERLGANQSPRREVNDLLLLLEENAKLRKLAVKLSNLLGDLPERVTSEIEPVSSRGAGDR
jgi:hypothetical protein